MKTFVTGVLVLCLAASAAALDFPTPDEVFSAPGDRILVRVGGIPITTLMLTLRNAPNFIRLMQVRNLGIKNGAWGEQNERNFVKAWDFRFRQTLAFMIRDELLYMLARKAKLVAFPSLVEKNTEEELSRMGGERALKERGLTIDDLREDVKKRLLIETVLQTQRPPVTPVGPAEARSFYEKHLKDFTLEGPGYRLRAIIMPRKTSKGEDNRPTIDKILEEINAGEDFARLAVRHSMHPSRNYGGLLLKVLKDGLKIDILKEKDIPRILKENLPMLREGKVYGPFTAEGGYHLVLLEKRFSPGVIPFEVLVNRIMNHLTLVEEDTVTRRWLTRLAKQAGVTDSAGKPISLDEIFAPEPPEMRLE